MNGNFQLRIPTPCHEDWEIMRPDGTGRFCEACSKTVADFSAMTDQEVIRFLGTAGQRVCGRFAPEQLDRDFELGVRRRARKGWQWLLAGLLVSAEARGQAVTKGEVVKVERRNGEAVKVERRDGETAKVERRDGVAMGDTVKVQVLDTVRVVGPGLEGRRLGGVMVACVRVTRGWTMVADTLAAVGLAPKRELEVYPNPARRGSVVSLRWQRTEPGVYEVDMFSSAGELVQRRKIEVGGKEQVDLLGLPPALPAGMYFLRAARPDGAKVITLRIMLI